MSRMFFIIIFSIISISPSFGQPEAQQFSWNKHDHTILGDNDLHAQIYTLVDGVLCHADTLENLLCLDYGWRNVCLEIFAAFYLSEKIPYVFSDKALPVLQVKGFNKIDVNGLIKLEEKTGPLFPWSYDKELVIWRVEAGSMETLLNSEGGIIHHLFNGEEMSIFFTLQNGTIMKSKVTLKGLPPLLLAVLEKAMEVKPEGQCAG